MKKLITLSTVLIFISTFSQKSIIPYNSLNGENGVGSASIGVGIWTKNSINNEVKGDTYLLKNWLSTMTIFTNDKNSFSVNNANFALLKSKFVTKLSKDSIFEFDNDNIKYVKLNDVVYKRFYYNNTNHFLAVLFNGNKASFLKKNLIYIKKGRVNPMTQVKIVKDSYAVKDKYFVFVKGEVQEIDLNKKEFLSLFKDKKNEVKSFMKQQKLSFKVEEDIVKLFKYYNSL